MNNKSKSKYTENSTRFELVNLENKKILMSDKLRRKVNSTTTSGEVKTQYFYYSISKMFCPFL